MDYSIKVVNEEGKNYFLACHEDKRFLFRRLDACNFISAPEGTEVYTFEVRRTGSVIMTGDCYNWHQKNAVFLIRYSEVDGYDPARNETYPFETLFADDFQPDDMIFSDVNVHDLRVKALLAVLSFMQELDEKMYSFRNGSTRQNVAMVIAANQSFITRACNDADMSGLKTFIVPIGF
jgi:hypothetical protein